MEKEIFSSFQLERDSQADIASVDIEEIKNEEKKLKRNSAIFTAMGLVALIGAAGLFLVTNPVPGLGLGGLLAGLAIGGAAAIGVGAVNLFRKAIGKPTLRFPKLKLLRKSMDTGKVETGMKPFTETTYMKKKLAKSDSDRVFFGVAGGLAEFAGVSPTLIRALFVAAFFFSVGSVTLGYFALALLMPIFKKNRRD